MCFTRKLLFLVIMSFKFWYAFVFLYQIDANESLKLECASQELSMSNVTIVIWSSVLYVAP